MQFVWFMFCVLVYSFQFVNLKSSYSVLARKCVLTFTLTRTSLCPTPSLALYTYSFIFFNLPPDFFYVSPFFIISVDKNSVSCANLSGALFSRFLFFFRFSFFLSCSQYEMYLWQWSILVYCMPNRENIINLFCESKPRIL